MSHRIVTRSLSGVACLVKSLWRRVRQEFQELPHASVVLQGRALHFETVFNLDQSICGVGRRGLALLILDQANKIFDLVERSTSMS